jgi:hypothetical protein
MRRKRWIFVAAPLALVLFVWLGGEAVMHLWNWLLPPLFGWHLLTFWQAVGFLALCRILFGNWGGHRGPRSHFRRRMDERWVERWEKMTPEEREKFRNSWRGRCGHFEEPTGGAKEPA